MKKGYVKFQHYLDISKAYRKLKKEKRGKLKEEKRGKLREENTIYQESPQSKTFSSINSPKDSSGRKRFLQSSPE